MRKSIIAAALTVFLAGGVITACSSDDSATKPAQKTATAKKGASKGNLPNYRYVDIDTVLSRYNLAKDYNEEMTRMQTNMENQLKRHESSLQAKAQSIQQKMQNNGYASEANYKADQDAFAKMQNNAQQTAGNLQNQYANEAMKAQQIVQDSIDAFIKDYNVSHGYDAIFFKNATLYINPELDITEEVIEGLNARYNKVKK
ncbi:MAG: OmpH family outer membrane protein [Muribaculaceae bacterium]|nr:OmpH family outer membrane protein [Muribaculaceae bacterium]